jgi:hypothetical protein
MGSAAANHVIEKATRILQSWLASRCIEMLTLVPLLPPGRLGYGGGARNPATV